MTCINKKLLCRWRIIQYRMKCFLFLFQPWLVKIALHYYLPIQFSWTQTDTSYLNPRLVIFKKKNDQRQTCFKQKWDSLGNSRQFISHCLCRVRPLFFVGRLILCPSGQVIIFFCDGGRFLQLKQSLKSPSTNRRSSPNHRKTIFFCLSSVGRSTLRHLGFRQAETDSRPKIDQGSLVCRTIFIYRLTDQWLHK